HVQCPTILLKFRCDMSADFRSAFSTELNLRNFENICQPLIAIALFPFSDTMMMIMNTDQFYPRSLIGGSYTGLFMGRTRSLPLLSNSMRSCAISMYSFIISQP